MADTKTKSDGARGSGAFTDAEKEAMKERAREAKAAKKGSREEGEAAILAKIAEMPPADRDMAERIHALISRIAPEHAADFTANAAAYKDELQLLHDELIAGLAVLPEQQRALVTCEGAFSYLTRDAGLREAYLWAVNADQQGTPQQIARTVDFVRANRVPAVFCESTVSDKAQRQVAADTGSEFGGILYVDSLSEPDGPVPTYLDLLRHDVRTITKGLAS